MGSVFTKFSPQAKGIILRSHRYALNQNEYVIGTEFLLLALFNEPNSSCQVLLGELGFTEEDLIDRINKINVFRKNIPGLIIYTPKLRLILEKAVELCKKTGTDFVYEEHLFYALLNTPDCIACYILDELEVDREDLSQEIIDVMGWDLENTKKKHKLNLKSFSFVENITELVEKGQLLPLIGREDILERINNVLNKKNKRNCILIGNAGVGKTAIVEGLAQKYYLEKKPIQIIALNVASLVAGTKYRGDFEQRLKDFIEAIKNREDVILFIDEIHNIINAGNSDNNLDMANILKPSLARGEIRCIGATTVDEYYKYIISDMALTRRFLPIFVDEPTIDETIHILLNIKKYFESFHQIVIPTETITHLVKQVEKALVERFFPDKAIDVLDEACAYAKIHKQKSLTCSIVDEIIRTITNQHLTKEGLNNLNKYPFLKKYYLRYYSNIRSTYQPIVSILCEYEDENELNCFLNDLACIFNIRSEAIKKINLNHFTDHHSISNLIGAPPGYVGFDNPHTLTRFVQKYPRSLILLKNIDCCALNVRELIGEILTSGYIEDFANHKTYFTNTIIIATDKIKQKQIGFLNYGINRKSTVDDLPFNERINLRNYLKMDSKEEENIIEQYRTFLMNRNINIDSIEKTQDDFETTLFDYLFSYK